MTEPDCTGADPAVVEGLSKAIGLWKFSAQVDNGEEMPLSECDESIAYRVGPEVVLGDFTHYVTCLVAHGEIVPLHSGNLGLPDGCIALACGVKAGVIWGSATSGSIFALDDTGHTIGISTGLLILRDDNHLVRAGIGGDVNDGYLMSRQAGNDVLACE